jgi:hypothetical protein
MVTIIKQSGNPVDHKEADKYSEEWKKGWNNLFDAYKDDMTTMQEKSQEFEDKLSEKYSINQKVDLPKNMKGWRKLLETHQSGIMIDEDVKTGKLMLVILDLGL